MAVLITGGAGFLGMHLARALAARGDQVLLGEIGDVEIPDDLRGRVTVVPCDVTAADTVSEAVRSTALDGIFHLAAAVRTTAELNPDAAYRVNVEGIYNVLEAARVVPIQRLVFVSTHAVFPPGTKSVTSETRPMQYANSYGIAKIFGEQMGLYYHLRHDLAFRATLCELETEKVAVDFESPVAGPLLDIVAASGETAVVGAVLCRIEADPNAGITDGR